MSVITHRDGPFVVRPHCPLCSTLVWVYRGQMYSTKEAATRARNDYINNRRNPGLVRRRQARVERR